MADCDACGRYTQRGGVRPFGISSLLAGFTPSGTPQLWHTDPTGVFSRWAVRSAPRVCVCWRVGRRGPECVTVHLLCVPRFVGGCLGQANAVGRNSKTLREFLEERYKPDLSEEETVRLAIRTLMEVRGHLLTRQLLPWLLHYG